MADNNSIHRIEKTYKRPEKIEYKKKTKQNKGVLSVNLVSEEVTLNGELQRLNKAPFKTFAGIFVPISVIKKMFIVTIENDYYKIERRK